MSLLIKGMEMPDFGERIIILTSSGYVEDVSGSVIQGVEAISVPPHGRCIDADKLVMENYKPYGAIDALALEAIKAAPTIIEAEEGE